LKQKFRNTLSCQDTNFEYSGYAPFLYKGIAERPAARDLSLSFITRLVALSDINKP